jgi:hypothetical protein
MEFLRKLLQGKGKVQAKLLVMLNCYTILRHFPVVGRIKICADSTLFQQMVTHISSSFFLILAYLLSLIEIISLNNINFETDDPIIVSLSSVNQIQHFYCVC